MLLDVFDTRAKMIADGRGSPGETSRLIHPPTILALEGEREGGTAGAQSWALHAYDHPAERSAPVRSNTKIRGLRSRFSTPIARV